MSPARARSWAPRARRLFEGESLRDFTRIVVSVAVGSLICLAVLSLTRLSV
jgi:hypothetical protein